MYMGPIITQRTSYSVYIRAAHLSLKHLLLNSKQRHTLHTKLANHAYSSTMLAGRCPMLELELGVLPEQIYMAHCIDFVTVVIRIYKSAIV